MAYSQDDLARIQAAIAKGELSVDFADRRVTYRSISDLLQAEAHILKAINTNTPRSKQSFGQSCKGL